MHLHAPPLNARGAPQLRLIKILPPARYEIRVSYGIALLAGSPVSSHRFCSERSGVLAAARRISWRTSDLTR